MSDYLSHLVARTLTPETGVRPQLRSAFEPPPLPGGFTFPVDFELETLVESNPPASLPLAAPTPFERVPSREPAKAAPTISPTRGEPPRQLVPPQIPTSIRGDLPPLESNEDLGIATVQSLPPPPPNDCVPSMKLKVLQPVIGAPPDSIPENSRAVSAPPATSRPDPLPPARHLRAAPASVTVHPAPTVVPHQTVESEELRSERIDLVAIRSVAPAATVLSPGPSIAPASDTPRLAASAIRRQTAEPKVPRSGRFTVAAIRPIVPAEPVLSPNLPPAVAPPPPTIHVTIGRLEVRATPAPPAGSRAKPTLPPVMSLEDYLGRRAAGGQR